MVVVGIIFSIGLLGVIIFFAVSPKSSKLLRLTAIVALGLIVISLVVCGIFIIKGPPEDPEFIVLPIFHDTEPQVKKPIRVLDLVILSVFIIGLSLVIAKAAKDQKKMQSAATKKKETRPFSGAIPDSNIAVNESDEDSFDFDDLDIK